MFSVVIPNWNGKQHLAICLDALRGQTYRDFEILLVDNGSSDGSQAFVQTQYPEVRLLDLGHNTGFTGACNAGIAAAQGEFIALLNNDTAAHPAWLAELAAGFTRYPQAGILASKLLLFDQRDTFHAAGDLFFTNGVPGNRGVWQKDIGQYAEGLVFSACGGAAAYRQSMLAQIGTLDGDFFFSCEDVDLAWRAQLRGWQVYYIPSAVVYHRLSATGGGSTASFYDGRNFIYVLVKDVPGVVWRNYGWQILSKQLKITWDALRAWRGAAARARLRGQWAGLLALPSLFAKRRATQAKTTLAESAILALLTPVDPH
jgi:GT2 family glycosyltransferase